LGQPRSQRRAGEALVSPNTEEQDRLGTWDAAMADFNGKTFEDMLKRLLRGKFGGSWQSGRAQGLVVQH